MFTITTIIHDLALWFFSHGAHHVQQGTGWVATKHYLTIVCRIPNTFHHGTFHCSGWVKR